MNESNSIETTDRRNLTEQTKFGLDEISKIENYFYKKINQRKSCSKKLSKYAAALHYIDKVLIVLSATSNVVSIIRFSHVVGAPVGITGARFTLIFPLTTGIIKKILSKTRKKRKRKSIIRSLCWLKVNSIALKL